MALQHLDVYPAAGTARKLRKVVSDLALTLLAADTAAAMRAVTAAAPLAGTVGGPPLVVVKTADESVTSNTTVQDDDHLTVPITAGSTWLIDATLLAEGATAGDFKFTFTAPTGATGLISAMGLAAAASSTGEVTAGAAGFGTEFTRGVHASAAAVSAQVYVVNPTNAGNVLLRWAQGTSNATPTVLKAGSNLKAYRVA